MTRAGDLKNDRAESAPAIDYLSKDFGSFRRLMLDRLASLAPGVATGHPADFGTTVVELLAYAGEQVSYYQDAVATEAYLDTARLRTSVRRHARLLDYPMHDGCNARAFVSIVVTSTANDQELPAGTRFLTRVPGQVAIVAQADIEPLRASGAQVFETLHSVRLRAAHNEMALASTSGYLAEGATAATLASTNSRGTLSLRIGDVVIFEEQAADGQTAGDPERRHAVRITSVDATSSATSVAIGWDIADALPFAMPIARTHAVGNVVLADHGYTLPESESIDLAATLAPGAGAGYGRPLLREGPLTFQTLIIEGGRAQAFLPGAPASYAIPEALAARTLLRPAITLTDSGSRAWNSRPDLLGSGPHACDFVIETEDDGRTYLRFGDGAYGARPSGALSAQYRIGNGKKGNVGAEAYYHIVSTIAGLSYARNPLPARGAIDPEAIDQVRLRAPQQFRRQQRAVTTDDYAAIALRFPEVGQANAVRRSTGGVSTIFLTVVRSGGLSVDADFLSRLEAFMELHRMAGHALRVRGPIEVPIQVALRIIVAPGHLHRTVLLDVQTALGTGEVNGQPALFHPDRVRLGEPLYLSQIIAAAMAVQGVRAVQTIAFKRINTDLSASGVITLSAAELPVVSATIILGGAS